MADHSPDRVDTTRVDDQDSVEQALSILRNPASSDPEIERAIGQILDHPDEPWPLTEQDLSTGIISRRLANAAQASPTRGARLLLNTTPSSFEPETRISMIESLSHTRQRPVVRALVREMTFPMTRSAAFDALSLLTGQSDLGPDPVAWQEWLDQGASLSDQQWLDSLFDAVITRVRNLESELEQSKRAMTDAYRRLYLATAQKQRPLLLAELLRSDQIELSKLGFELADRELAANADLGPAVGEAALERLGNPQPEIRAAAARLVNRLAPQNAAQPVTRALLKEENSIVAKPLLQAVTRWPSPELVRPVLKWMADPSTVEAACQAGSALYDAGLIVGDDTREQVRTLITPIPENPSTPRLILLAKVGTTDDLSSIASLLKNKDEQARLPAMDALARVDAGADLLITASRTDPRLAATSLLALSRHDRLGLVPAEFATADLWKLAFEQASSSQVRSRLARQILDRFGASLTEEQKSTYERALNPG